MASVEQEEGRRPGAAAALVEGTREKGKTGKEERKKERKKKEKEKKKKKDFFFQVVKHRVGTPRLRNVPNLRRYQRRMGAPRLAFVP